MIKIEIWNEIIHMVGSSIDVFYSVLQTRDDGYVDIGNTKSNDIAEIDKKDSNKDTADGLIVTIQIKYEITKQNTEGDLLFPSIYYHFFDFI